jgi:hypothetical protein
MDLAGQARGLRVSFETTRNVDGLQTDRALVRTARRPNYARGTVDCKVRRARWSRGAAQRSSSASETTTGIPGNLSAGCDRRLARPQRVG